jgi:hypothetical protein
MYYHTISGLFLVVLVQIFTLQIYVYAMLLLVIVRNWKVWGLGYLQCNNTHTKHKENCFKSWKGDTQRAQWSHNPTLILMKKCHASNNPLYN